MKCTCQAEEENQVLMYSFTYVHLHWFKCLHLRCVQMCETAVRLILLKMVVALDQEFNFCKAVF